MLNYDLTPLESKINTLHGFFWDLDGTLAINNEAAAHDVIRRHIFDACCAVHEDFKNRYCNYDVSPTYDLAGKPIREIIDEYAQYLCVDLDTDKIEEKIMQHRKLMPSDDEQIDVLPVFQQILTFLNDKGVPQKIVTSSEEDRAHRYIGKSGLSRFFNTHSASKFVFVGHKPKPDPYIEAFDNLRTTSMPNVMKNKCIGLEDSPTGVASCLGAGMVPIGHVLATHIVDKYKQAERLKKAGAKYVIMSEEDVVPVLCNALHDMSSPQQKPLTTKLPYKPKRRTPIYYKYSILSAN